MSESTALLWRIWTAGRRRSAAPGRWCGRTARCSASPIMTSIWRSRGSTFAAESGLTAKALQQTTGLAVDNSEAVGALIAMPR